MSHLAKSHQKRPNRHDDSFMAFTTAQHSSYWTQEGSLVPRLDRFGVAGGGRGHDRF